MLLIYLDDCGFIYLLLGGKSTVAGKVEVLMEKSSIDSGLHLAMFDCRRVYYTPGYGFFCVCST